MSTNDTVPQTNSLTSFTDLLYILMYAWVKETSSILKVTPVKLSCLAMYIPLSFMSIATISMAPTPLRSRGNCLEHTNTKSVSPGREYLPSLNRLDKVAKLSEGRFVAPDAQSVHVGHVPWLRRTFTEGTLSIVSIIAVLWSKPYWICLLTSSTGIHNPSLGEFVLQFQHCQTGFGGLGWSNGTHVFGFVTLIVDNLTAVQLRIMKNKTNGINISLVSPILVTLRAFRKDTTPSKSSPHQWRSCSNLVLYFPPDWLSPIKEE